MHVHGDNLQQKEAGEAKYADAESRRFLQEIRKQYGVWKKANEELKEGREMHGGHGGIQRFSVCWQVRAIAGSGLAI